LLAETIFMALDIAKLGRKPYQKLEQPEVLSASGVYIRQHAGNFFVRVLNILVVSGIFFVLAWVWDFGGFAGFGRSVVWLVFSGALLVVFSWRLFFGREFLKKMYDAREYWVVVRLALVVLVVSGIGSFSQRGVLGALGLSASASALSWLGVVFGVVWLVAMLYGRGTSAASKQVLVSLFFGSTVLAGYILYMLLFGGGYAALGWVEAQGVLLLLSIDTFLIVSFAIFQNRAIKILWSLAIALHVFVLFAWDIASVWLVLIAGISALLFFQVIYSKKLWQRNFIYPLQVWAIAALLLVVPIKIFTGASVPHDSILSYADSRAVAWSQEFLWLGNGLGSSNEYAIFSDTSFIDFGSLETALRALPVIGNAYIQIYIETGSVGLLSWLLFFGIVCLLGIRFWRNNTQAFKEGSMSEGAYLGAILLITYCLLLVGFWFSPFSFVLYWFSMVIVACAMVLWHTRRSESESSAHTVPYTIGRTLLQSLGVVMLIVMSMYVGLLVVSARMVRASQTASQLSSEIDARARADGWQRVVSLSSWNPFYRLSEARAFLDLLETSISIDAQRESIERVTAILSNESKHATNPIIHWVAAGMYADLESYAEGSSSFARREYQAAREIAPNNAQLAVAIARFYRDQADTLVSANVPARELRFEAAAGLKQVLLKYPSFLPARLELAFLLEEEEGVSAALGELAAWENASPEITYHIGRLYFNEGEFEKSSEKFLEVIRAVPNHSNAHYSLGIAYFRLKKYPEALEQFKDVLRLNPGSSDVQAKIDQVQKLVGE